MTREEYLAAMGRLYDNAQRRAAGVDNRPVETAVAEDVGELGQVLTAAGVMGSLHEWFRRMATGGVEKADSDLTDAELFRGAGYVMFLLRAVMPGEVGAGIAGDLTMLGEGVRPPRIVRMVTAIKSTLATDAGSLSTITGICGAAFYKAGLDGVRDWLPAHREIYPGDRNDRPDDKTRREWVAIARPGMMETFRRAGEERRRLGPDAELPQELAVTETWARATINNPPADNVSLLEFVKAQKKAARR